MTHLDPNTLIVLLSVGACMGYVRAWSQLHRREIYEIRRNLKRLMKKLGEPYVDNGHEDPPARGAPIPD